MKTNKASIFRAITVLLLVFCGGVIKAQSQVVPPYPDTEGGQVLTIDENDEDWYPVMDAAAQVRQQTIDAINTGGNPADRWSCIGTICCYTEWKACWHAGGPHSGHWVTFCYDYTNIRYYQEFIQ